MIIHMRERERDRGEDMIEERRKEEQERRKEEQERKVHTLK